MTDSVDVKFGASTDDFSAGTGRVEESLGRLGAAARDTSSIFRDFAEAMIAGFAVKEFDEFIGKVSEFGEQLERTAAMTGLSVDAIQNFSFAVQATGGDAETAQSSILRMERNMSLAASQGGALADAFTRAGVSAKTLASGNVDEALAEMADKFHETADGANKTEAAMEIAGRGGAALIPILDQGRDGLASLGSALDATGAKLSPEMAEKFAQTHQQITIFDTAARGASEAIFAGLEPGVNALYVGLTQLSEEFTQNVKEGGAFGTIVETLGHLIAALAIAIDAVKTAFEGWVNAVETGVKIMIEAFITLGKVWDDVFTLQFGQMVSDFKAGWAEMTATVNQSVEEMASAGNTFGQNFMHIMDAATGGPVGFAKKGGPKATAAFPAPPPPEDDKEKEDFSTKRSLYAEDYQNKKEYDDLMVESGSMSRKQEIADLQAALTQEQALTDASFINDALQYDIDSAKYNQLMDEKTRADEKFNIEHMKLTMEGTKEDAKFWTQAIDTIDKSFDQMLQGILQGTQTIAQTFQKMAQNMVISFMEAIAKMIIQWGAFQALGAGSGIKDPFGGGGGGSAQGGQNLTQQLLTGILSLVGITTSDVAAGSAEVAALSANTAALAANTAAQGAGAAGGGGSALGDIGEAVGAVGMFFAEGTNYVPRTGLAVIHEGETVIPRGQSDAIRAGESSYGGGAGSHVHFHVNTLDSASAASMFERHHAAISKGIQAAMRGNSSGLRAAFARM